MKVAKKAFFFTRDRLLYILGSCCQKSQTQPEHIGGSNMEEKKYLLKTDCSYEYICAIKKDGKFLNLISGETIDYAETYNSKQNATLLVRFIADRRSDL